MSDLIVITGLRPIREFENLANSGDEFLLALGWEGFRSSNELLFEEAAFTTDSNFKSFYGQLGIDHLIKLPFLLKAIQLLNISTYKKYFW